MSLVSRPPNLTMTNSPRSSGAGQGSTGTISVTGSGKKVGIVATFCTEKKHKSKPSCNGLLSHQEGTHRHTSDHLLQPFGLNLSPGHHGLPDSLSFRSVCAWVPAIPDKLGLSVSRNGEKDTGQLTGVGSSYTWDTDGLLEAGPFPSQHETKCVELKQRR